MHGKFIIEIDFVSQEQPAIRLNIYEGAYEES